MPTTWPISGKRTQSWLWPGRWISFLSRLRTPSASTMCWRGGDGR
nr:MAG TPA: hypothetical protein [Caudoviricetes sp.]